MADKKYQSSVRVVMRDEIVFRSVESIGPVSIRIYKESSLDLSSGGAAKSGGQPHGPSEKNECSPALLSHEQTSAAQMPSPSGAGLERMPVSRGEGRGAKG